MTLKISAKCDELLARQDGVIGRSQGLELGISGYSMRHRARVGEWQRIQRGVYAAFSGEVTREARLWAALLRAGPGAVLSHQTAAELYGLIKEPRPLIHVTVPADSNPAKSARIPGVMVHRSRILDRTRHPVLLPPRTRIEDTVLDLMEEMDSPADRYDLICRAIGGRLTTAARLRLALKRRQRFRDRREAESALEDAGQGALSNLERWYLRGVERRHELPVAKRQARRQSGGQSIYLDNLYEDYLLCVELDGTAAHPAAEQWRDKRRDRRNLAAEQIVTMRFGYSDLNTEQAQCRTAAEIARVLASRGPKTGASCRLPGCSVSAVTGAVAER
jgi:very-short-patch-repair endonuclease